MIKNIAVPMSPVFGRVKPLRLMMVSVIVASVALSVLPISVILPVALSSPSALAVKVVEFSECLINVLTPVLGSTDHTFSLDHLVAYCTFNCTLTGDLRRLYPSAVFVSTR